MELKEFVDDFNPTEKIRITHKDEIVYAGEIESLVKLLNYKVIKKSGKYADGMMQIEIREFL